MLDAPKLTVDFTQKQSVSTILPRQPLLRSDELGWSGIYVQHHHQPASESPEHILNHHVIVHHPGWEMARSKRCLAGNRQQEDLIHGSCVIVPASVLHQVTWDRELEFTLLILEPAYLTQLAREMVDGDRVELIPQFAKLDPVISNIAFALKAELETNGIKGRLYVEAATTFLASHLLRHYCTHTHSFSEYSSGLSKYRLREAIAYIQEHLSEEISLGAIAQHLCMSQYYFCHLFKQSMGVSPYQYVLQQRIEKAKQLLKHKELSVTDVALKCGFTNQTHFTKHFRQLIGITPRAYQEHRFTQFDTAILTIGVALKSELETGSIERKRYAELANTFLAAHFLRDSCTRDRFLKAYTGKLPNHKLKQAIEYIEQHLGEKISLETIAQHLDISQCHFCHLFKQSMGVSPYQYVLQQRIEKAKHLLKQQKLTITNVALECGFANQTHFTKHFRKLTGTTPKAYRKQQSHSCQNLPSLMAQLQCC